ncbi:MAG: ABC transporter permease [Ignavibacteriales bacterium]|nr:MAG: FtsX-like permease family protein [Ignavibacteriaceae bacterium]MBW7872890.1 ABC transporter permease [Ignavibacteria bacterium]MCZ2142481.1 ABC transporter permease [Ignavibacteriales bacterium]MBV6445362.1 Macrolide export ATP-binding/permease protein MacB [Ignavibacteriaceae bacterium]MBZ0196455.1 ABC transporter permease [Ignavibacteriaceae bacterium]
MTSLFESLKLALMDLRANKLRASLTMLGIVVGIFSIIVIMTVITMLQSSIEEGVSMLAKNTFQIQKFPAIRTGGPGMWSKYRNRKDLTLQEYERLRNNLPSAKYIGAEQGQFGKVIKFRNKETNPNVNVVGITPSAIKTNDWKVENGREIRETDVQTSANVVILGKDVADKLFEFIDPIGKEVRVDGHPLRVIGVYEAQGQMFGQSRDNFVTMPITTQQAFYGKYNRSISITVTSYSKDDYNKVIETAIGVMRAIRKNPPGSENDFEIFSNESVLSEINSVTIYAKIGAIVVSFIALIAAGVGIMNIMLVSVTERTREVGVRKAIGAKSYQILMQFMTEAILLCLLGGLVGIVLGVGIGNFAGSFLNASAAVPYDWIMIGIGLCVLVGVLFGTYPAYKAANLDPIEALRYEQ